jgi:hypothetical protein
LRVWASVAQAGPDAPLADFVAEADRHPIFEVVGQEP